MRKWLTDDFIRTLEQLSFLSKKIFYGGMQGGNISRRHGSSMEFADYRRYHTGDDLRYIDWNLYARLDKLLIKLFQEETNIFIYILVDISRSMDFGSPSKLQYALKVAAALSYIGVANTEQVGICTFSSKIEQRTLPYYGKIQLKYLFEFLSQVDAKGESDLNASLEMFASSVNRPGIVIVISDFWDEQGYENGLKYLLQKKFEISIIRLLTVQETAPQQMGALSICDLEGGQHLNLNVNRNILTEYQRMVTEHNHKLAGFAQRYNISYLNTLTDIPFEELALRYMRIRGT